MLYTILFSIYLIISILMVLSLLVNGVRPTKTLAWLLAMFTIPVGGILLYLLVGRNRRKNKLIRLKRKFTATDANAPNKHSIMPMGRYNKIMKLIYANNHFLPTEHNEIEYLKDGKSTFDAIFKALGSATDYIHFQYYILEDGDVANKLLDLFSNKIAKGVKIRLIYDSVGSISLSTSYLKKLAAIGVEAYPFLPFKFGRFLASINYRNHRKIVVVDGQTAFTGGINISDKYLKGDPDLGKWHDMHLMINGPAVDQLNHVFLTDWQLVSGVDVPRTMSSKSKNQEPNTTVQIVYSGPDDDFPAIEQLYHSIIGQANHYLYITNPYLIPSHAIFTALETAALSGIDVRILISEKTDSRLVNWSVRSYFEPLLKAGIQIYLFPHGFLHSKVMVADDAITSIGTANIDVRSLEQNYEVNAVIYDEGFAKEIRLDFLNDCSESRPLTYEEHQKRPWTDRLKEGFARVFSPLL